MRRRVGIDCCCSTHAEEASGERDVGVASSRAIDSDASCELGMVRHEGRRVGRRPASSRILR